MTKVEKTKLKKIIKKKIEDLEISKKQLDEALNPIGYDVAVGRLSRMDALNEKSVREANLRSLEEKLYKIKKNLKEIDDSHFGICIGCEKPIPFARIEAIPDCNRCVNCA